MDTTTDLKFTADRMALLAAARQCALIAPSSSPVRELECVLLETDSAENRLALSATDLEVALRLTLPIRSSTDGKFSLAINAKFFTAMLEKLGGADVDIALKPGAQLELKSGAAFYRVPALSGERYPSIELPLPEARTEVCGLPELIRHTAFAVSETSAMPLLKCVNLRFTPDGLKAVGSDGLCIAEAAGDIRCTGSVSFLVAASSLSKLSKLCCNEDTLSVGTAGKSLVFLKDGFEFSARLMEGRYADTDRIIRQLSPSFTVLLDSAELRRAGYDDEIISEATGFAETDNQLILEARELFQQKMEEFKKSISVEAEKVKEAGGLFIIGTERHESRRIDNQLRGRAGRQGDPGESRFYLSLEDDLMRLFGGERIQGLMDKLGAEDDMPIEAKILSNSIESAQMKVEARNFGIRKNVLQFDDVMNSQREVIYSQRAKVLDGEDISGIIKNMVHETINSTVDQYLADTEVHDNWNLAGLRDYFLGWLTVDSDLRYDTEQLAKVTPQEIKDMLNKRADLIYQKREEAFTSPIMREVERVVLLRNVDTKWMQHIDDMEELKRGMYLRGYAQRDPVVEYRLEGSEMFDAMIASIREDTVKLMFTLQLRRREEPKREQVAKPTQEALGSSDGTISKQPARRSAAKVGRNDPCPCGSGKKYKKCCGRDA